MIDDSVRLGTATEKAATDAIARVERWQGTGGAIVLNPQGKLVVICDTPAMARGWGSDKGSFAEILLPDSGQ
jgi:isoaspartyl peptidase/L-asparaginase-like protein (Ntn-hydrolase superfamily)